MDGWIVKLILKTNIAQVSEAGSNAEDSNDSIDLSTWIQMSNFQSSWPCNRVR